MVEQEKIVKGIEELNYDGKIESKDEVLEESLTVIAAARSELAQAYAQHKELTATIESLSSQVEELSTKKEEYEKTIESLRSELEAYKAREAEAAKAAYMKRLESLSSSFKELGQEKTVEELSKLPEEVITEFETITSLALQKRSDESLSISTVPTQAMPAKPQQPPKKEHKVESLNSDNFIEGVCNILREKSK